MEQLEDGASFDTNVVVAANEMDDAEIGGEEKKREENSSEGVQVEVPETVKYFTSKSSFSPRSGSQNEAHEREKRRHFNQLGSATFVGGATSPPSGSGPVTPGGRGGLLVQRRRTHAQGVPGTATGAGTGAGGAQAQQTSDSVAALQLAGVGGAPAPTGQSAAADGLPVSRPRASNIAGAGSEIRAGSGTGTVTPGRDMPPPQPAAQPRRSLAGSLFAPAVPDEPAALPPFGSVSGFVPVSDREQHGDLPPAPSIEREELSLTAGDSIGGQCSTVSYRGGDGGERTAASGLTEEGDGAQEESIAPAPAAENSSPSGGSDSTAHSGTGAAAHSGGNRPPASSSSADDNTADNTNSNSNNTNENNANTDTASAQQKGTSERSSRPLSSSSSTCGGGGNRNSSSSRPAASQAAGSQGVGAVPMPAASAAAAYCVPRRPASTGAGTTVGAEGQSSSSSSASHGATIVTSSTGSVKDRIKKFESLAAPGQGSAPSPSPNAALSATGSGKTGPLEGSEGKRSLSGRWSVGK